MQAGTQLRGTLAAHDERRTENGRQKGAQRQDDGQKRQGRQGGVPPPGWIAARNWDVEAVDAVCTALTALKGLAGILIVGTLAEFNRGKAVAVVATHLVCFNVDLVENFPLDQNVYAYALSLATIVDCLLVVLRISALLI